MKKSVIIDMNLTEDFALGFMAAVMSGELDIIGLTLCFGETSLDCAAANTAALLSLMGRKIPTALGAKLPWRRAATVPMKALPLTKDINGLQVDMNVELGEEMLSAPEFLYEKLKESPQKVTLLCAGPLTNIALLLERHPDAVSYIEQLVWRGGTQRHGVNGIVRDLQTLMDPEAAQMVLESGLDFVMCPVDMGSLCYGRREEIDDLAGCLANGPADVRVKPASTTGHAVWHQYHRLLKKRWCEVNEELPMGQRNRPLPLQELAAALYLTHPELFGTRRVYGEVDVKGRLTFGMLVIDIDNRLEHSPEAFNICWLDSVNREGALRYLYGGV